MKKIAKVDYRANLRTENSHLQSGASFITDAPTDNHGKGEAFSPTDLLATSLANCALTVMAIYASKKDIRLDHMQAAVYKEMSKAPRRLAKIQVEISIKAGIDESQKKELMEIAKNCPVALSLDPAVKQNFLFIWND